MKRIIAFVLAVMMTVVLLAGCGSGGKERRVVNVCSWGEYIDESLIGEFESQPVSMSTIRRRRATRRCTRCSKPAARIST